MVPSRPANFNRSSPFLTSLRDPEGQRNSLSRCSGDTGFAQLCGFCLPMDAMGSRAAFRKVGHPFFYSKNQHIPQVDPSRTLDLKHVCHGTCQRCGSQFSSSRRNGHHRACVRVRARFPISLYPTCRIWPPRHSSRPLWMLRRSTFPEKKELGWAKDRQRSRKWVTGFKRTSVYPKKRGFLIE